MFPGHGERGAFLNRVVSIVVEDREDLEGYLHQGVFEAVREGGGEGWTHHQKGRRRKMADFCNQCSMDMFGEELGDLKNITSSEDFDNGKAAVVICEGCGFIQVDPIGRCISSDCLKAHGT